MTFNEWLLLTKSKEAFERSFCLDEIPEDVSHEQVVPVLLELLEDEEELVRTCAAEELVGYAEYQTELIRASLKKMIEKENSILAKSYAIVSFCQIVTDENDLTFISHILQTEKNAYVKLHASFGLFLIAQNFLIDVFSKNIHDDELKFKLSSINTMKLMYESIYFHRKRVISLLQEQLSSEANTSVSDTIKNVLLQIDI